MHLHPQQVSVFYASVSADNEHAVSGHLSALYRCLYYASSLKLSDVMSIRGVIRPVTELRCANVPVDDVFANLLER